MMDHDSGISKIWGLVLGNDVLLYILWFFIFYLFVKNVLIFTINFYGPYYNILLNIYI